MKSPLLKRYFWFVCLFFATGCASLPVYKCKVVKDAGKDFPQSPSKYTDEEGLIEFGLARDTQNVYISIAFLDKMASAKLMRDGFNVYFNPHGKKKKEFTLMFPVKGDGEPFGSVEPRNDYERLAAQQQKHDPKGMKQKFPAEARWKDKEGTSVFRWREGSYPCKLQIATNEGGQLVYDIAVPLDILYKNNKKKKVLAIGFESKASENEMGNKMGGPSDGGGPGGEGGMGAPGGAMSGGGPGGGRPGGNMGPKGGPQGQPGQDKDANKSLKTWFAITLND